jgi:drug/metabolite transporter (DMT)-like permease
MTAPAPPPASAPAAPPLPTVGIALMATAMLSFPLVDGLAKHLTGTASPYFVAWARYAVASLVVLPFALRLHGRHIFPREQLASHLARTVFLVLAMTLFYQSMAMVPLATTISAYFIGPIVAAALSVLLLGETMTPQKGLGLALGVAGTLVILRPGSSLEPGVLLALGAGLAYAFYLVATRRAAMQSDPVKTLIFQCVVGTVLMTPQAWLTWSTPQPAEALLYGLVGLGSAACHMLVILAFRRADATTLAPLVYLELVGGALIGYFAFGEIPGPATFLGAACIVAGGFALLRRPRFRRR